MKNPKNFLVFCGNPGIGKTHLCASLVEFGMKRFKSFRYHHERSLFTKLRDNMSQFGGGDYIKLLESLIDDDFIMLDDIGSQGVNEWRSEVIFDAIDYRYNSCKPTLITSNFSKQEFFNKYPSRLGSRLFAKENTIIELHNEIDLRQEGK